MIPASMTGAARQVDRSDLDLLDRWTNWLGSDNGVGADLFTKTLALALMPAVVWLIMSAAVTGIHRAGQRMADREIKAVMQELASSEARRESIELMAQRMANEINVDAVTMGALGAQLVACEARTPKPARKVGR